MVDIPRSSLCKSPVCRRNLFAQMVKSAVQLRKPLHVIGYDRMEHFDIEPSLLPPPVFNMVTGDGHSIALNTGYADF
jgi:hypothetical protein